MKTIKKIVLRKFVIGFIFLIPIAAIYAQNLPDKATILEKMTLANSYFMNKWPDPTVDIVTDKVRPSNLWTRAAYYEGLMALYSIDSKEDYYQYEVTWAEGHQWKPTYGNLATTDADHQCFGWFSCK